MALLRAQDAIEKMRGGTLDEKTGRALVIKSLEEPLRQIATNAGYEGGVIVEQVRALEGSMGFNAATGEYEDLLKAGIADPAKVTRSTLQNAASIAALLHHHRGAGRREEGRRSGDARHARRAAGWTSRSNPSIVDESRSFGAGSLAWRGSGYLRSADPALGCVAAPLGGELVFEHPPERVVEPFAGHQDLLAEQPLVDEAELLGDPLAGCVAGGDPQRHPVETQFLERHLRHPGGGLGTDALAVPW